MAGLDTHRGDHTTTDIAARGIDVSDISHVISFDMPDTVDAYTHRIGRTGRVHKSGEAFTFVVQGDEPLVREIERVLGRRIERRSLPGFSYGSSAEESQSEGSHPNHPRKRRPNRKHNQDRNSRERTAAATLGGRI